MAIVYVHRRADTDEIFYVGIGVIKNRAYQKRSRNELWYNIVNKYGYNIEIIYDNISLDSAKKIEVDLIQEYGRLDLGTGILSNMTDGGDGSFNLSQESRDKISKSLTGLKQSDDTIIKRSISLKDTWQKEELRELKREQTKKLWEDGILKGHTGLKQSEETKSKRSNTLKQFYIDNPDKKVYGRKPANYKDIDKLIEESIVEDYKNGIVRFALHKKYKLNRKIIDRILISYGIEF